MADMGTRYTDERRRELEQNIHEIYRDAERDIENKLNEHMRKFAVKDRIYQEKLQKGEITPEYYARWKSGQVFIGKMWEQKKADIHHTAMNAGKASMDIINRKSHDVFQHNLNIQNYMLEKQFGAVVGLNLYDTHAVSRLLRDNPKMLPEWKIDQPKQYIWDEKRVNVAITQGIIQGESLDKIAKRIAVGLCGSDEKRMNLFAQTAMTGAQNAGRLESIREATEMGLETEKGWDATLDKHTRETHRILDGTFVDEDEDFKVNGMHIRYPGDPDAPAELVYNCRCALVGRVKKYNNGYKYKRRDNITGENFEYKTYKEWATDKGKPKPQPQPIPQPVPQPVPQQEQPQRTILEQIREKIDNHQGEWSVDELQEVGKLVDREYQDSKQEMIDAFDREIKEMQEQKDALYDKADECNNAVRDELKKEVPDQKRIAKLKREARNAVDKAEKLRLAKWEKSKKRCSEQMKTILSRIRPIGGVTEENWNEHFSGLYLNYKGNKTKQAMIDTLNCYPASWLEKSKNRAGRYGTKLCPHWTEKRAYYSQADGEIRLSDRQSTCIHEMGHRVESTNEAVLKSEAEFYKRRTAGEELQWLGSPYGSYEKSRFDKFLHKYCGKDYGGGAYELVSMGFQWAYTDYDLLAKDEDMQSWILGILACID